MDLHGFGALVKGTGIMDWVLDGFYDSRPTNEEMVRTGRRGIGGKRLSHLFRCIHLELISFCGLCLYARLFFSSSFYSIFTCVFFLLIKLFYSLICMKEHRHGYREKGR